MPGIMTGFMPSIISGFMPGIMTGIMPGIISGNMAPEQIYIVPGIVSGLVVISSMSICVIILRIIWHYGDDDGDGKL